MTGKLLCNLLLGKNDQYISHQITSLSIRLYKRFIEKITVYYEKLVVEFKSGFKIDAKVNIKM